MGIPRRRLGKIGDIGQATGVSAVLRRPLLAVPVILTAVTGLAIAGIGVGTVVANSKTFGLGVAAVLIAYGLMLVLLAWAVTRRRAWALGLVVGAALLHLMVMGSLLTTDDRPQLIGSLIVTPFVLATLVTSVLAVGRRELDRLSGQPASADGDQPS